MLSKALSKFIGWILWPAGVCVIVITWLGYFSMGKDVGIGWLIFLDGSLGWAIIFTLIGGFLTSLGLVMARS